MSNMSYCRFQNTLGDLVDCQAALERIFACDTEDGDDVSLSEDELRAAKRMIATCRSILTLAAEAVANQDGSPVCIHVAMDDVNDALEEANETLEDAVSDEEDE